MTPTEQDKELREQVVKCFTDTEMEHDQELTLFDTDQTIENLMQLITADRKRVAVEAEIAQLKSVVAVYEIYSHGATQFYKSIVKALLNKGERFYREYGEHALYQTDIDHLKAQQEEVK